MHGSPPLEEVFGAGEQGCGETCPTTRRNEIDEAKLKELLESIQLGALSVEEALSRLKNLPYENLGFAELDHHRALRKGFPEVVLGEGKTPEQIATIAEKLAAQSDRLLITRASVDAYQAVKERVPDAVYRATARAITLERSDTSQTSISRGKRSKVVTYE